MAIEIEETPRVTKIINSLDQKGLAQYANYLDEIGSHKLSERVRRVLRKLFTPNNE